MKKIEIFLYNPDWPDYFKQEAAILRSNLGDNCINIYHIGSTAVPGLYAKPKIDILAEVKDINKAYKSVLEIDYEYLGEFNIPLRYFFRKKKPYYIHLHIYEKDNPDITLNILFKDFLLNSQSARAEYNKLKLSLLRKNKFHLKVGSIFTDYNLGKDKFIRKILDMSGYNGLSFRFCTHYIEWEAYHHIAQQFFNAQNVIYNQNNPNFSDNNYYHFILSKGTKIAAISELKWLEKTKPKINYICSSYHYEKLDLETHLKNLIIKWIKSKQDAQYKIN